MKILKTYYELYESLSEWLVDNDPKYTWIDDISGDNRTFTGYVLYRKVMLQNTLFKNITYKDSIYYPKRNNEKTKDVDFHIKNNKIIFCDINPCLLTKEEKIRTAFYIMFEMKTINLWFNTDSDIFNDENARNIEHGKYLEQYKELKKKIQVKKFKI